MRRPVTLHVYRREPPPAQVIADAVNAATDEWLWEPLTQQEAADWLRIHVDTLSLWTSAGRVPHYRLASKPRYLRADLLPLLRAGQLPLPSAADELAAV